MKDISWFNSLRATIDALTIGNWEEMNQVRMLIGIPAEDFETLLALVNKSTYSRICFKISARDMEVELGKVSDDQLEVKIIMANAHGEVTLRFPFRGNEQGCGIER